MFGLMYNARSAYAIPPERVLQRSDRSCRHMHALGRRLFGAPGPVHLPIEVRRDSRSQIVETSTTDKVGLGDHLKTADALGFWRYC